MRRGACLSVTALIALGWGCLGISVGAWATEGSFLGTHDPVMEGFAGAGAASPRSASWMLLNPASIIELDKRIDAGIDVCRTHFTLRPSALFGNPFAGEMKDNRMFYVPYGGMIWPLKKGTLGLGGYVPGAMSSNYPHSRFILSPIRDNHGDRYMDYRHGRFVLAYAYPLDCGWALGVSGNLSTSELKTDGITRFLLQVKHEGTRERALGVGFSVGVYKNWEKWAFGAAYTTREWSQYFDDYKDLMHRSVDMPPVFQAGISYKLRPSLELIADYKYIRWTEMRLFAERPAQGGYGWRDQSIGKIAVEWKVADDWALRAGYSRGNENVRPGFAFANAYTPVIVVDFATVGVSHTINERFDIHASYNHMFYNSMTNSVKGDWTSPFFAGTKIGIAHDSVALGMTYKF
ncbi:MAG TPA: outer membrane protein transport protein [Candidatus Hydrogenedentes bacterium]|nr:outer membrane protein transport protein [Candidatus Hydrogenedentota bacterium]HPG70316.1 outer membrane protein transport protein [Candidatus Hydrogenedentota bacterium]